MDGRGTLRSGQSFRARRPVQNVTSEHFPMICLSMDTFMEQARMPSNGELDKQDLLRPPAEAVPVHFISHEWLGSSHPDPEGTQLRRMQAVFLEVAGGRGDKLFDPAVWETFRTGSSRGSVNVAMQEQENEFQSTQLGSGDDFAAEVTRGAIWLDFACIPQLCDVKPGGDVRRQLCEQQAAVNSIAAYLERADYFWILAPAAEHVDKQGRRDFSTYRRRAWCRFEECANLLSHKAMMPIVVTEKTRLASYSAIEIMWHLASSPSLGPSSGDASCCERGHVVHDGGGRGCEIACDKEILVRLLTELFEARLDILLKNRAWVMLFTLLGPAPTILAGGPRSRQRVCQSIQERVRCFEWGADGEVESGFTPMHVATILNDMLSVQILLGYDGDMHFEEKGVSGRTPFDLCSFSGNVELAEALLAGRVGCKEDVHRYTPLGAQMLHRAAGYGHVEMVRRILAWRARVDDRKSPASAYAGQTALHSAALHGHAVCCEVLLEHRADACAEDVKGVTPLHSATMQPVYVAGSREPGACEKVIQLLLAARGTPTARDHEGRSVLDRASAWGIAVGAAPRRESL